MAGYGRPSVWVERVFSSGVGGLIVLAVIGAVGLAPLRRENAALSMRLGELERRATPLPAGSMGTAEGRILHDDQRTAVAPRSQRWDAAIDSVRSAWEKATAAEIRAEADAVRQQVEASMAENLSARWERARDRVRLDWERAEM